MSTKYKVTSPYKERNQCRLTWALSAILQCTKQEHTSLYRSHHLESHSMILLEREKTLYNVLTVDR